MKILLNSEYIKFANLKIFKIIHILLIIFIIFVAILYKSSGITIDFALANYLEDYSFYTFLVSTYCAYILFKYDNDYMNIVPYDRKQIIRSKYIMLCLFIMYISIINLVMVIIIYGSILGIKEIDNNIYFNNIMQNTHVLSYISIGYIYYLLSYLSIATFTFIIATYNYKISLYVTYIIFFIGEIINVNVGNDNKFQVLLTSQWDFVKYIGSSDSDIILSLLICTIYYILLLIFIKKIEEKMQKK